MSNVKKGFDKTTVGQFRVDFQNAIAGLEAKYKVNIKLGTLTYTEEEVRGKMTATKGEKTVKPQINEFKIGDIVSINHKKVDPNKQYKIAKINKKSIKVVNLNNKFNIVKVSPGLLVKVNPQLQSVIDKF
jgi:NMD protein affecting ribosome stability and mRNA decay